MGKAHTITNNQAGIYRSETGGFGTNSSLDNQSGVYGNGGGVFGTNSSLDNQSGVYGNEGGGFGTNATGFECDICGKIIVTMSNLRRHRRLHTGEKPFTCGTCERKFSDGGNFTKHLRTFGHVKVAKK